jgi:hypothetical protein
MAVPLEYQTANLIPDAPLPENVLLCVVSWLSLLKKVGNESQVILIGLLSVVRKE